jgi:hypothetical protein
MKKTLAVVVTISLGLFMLFSLSSCGAREKATEKIVEGAIEEAIEDESGGKVDITEDTMTVKTDEGETVFSSKAELPEGFPADVPLYPDMTITSSMKSLEDNKEVFYITADISAPSDEVVSWYKNNLTGWKIDSEITEAGENGKTTAIGATRDSYLLGLWIGDTDKGTSIILSVGEEEN